VSKNLRCYAEGRDGDWEAICLDLDIAVQGSSFEEVFSSLQDAITLYQGVADLPPNERRALLRRPAPLSVRFRFLTHALRGFLPYDDGDRQRHQFTCLSQHFENSGAIDPACAGSKRNPPSQLILT
jgi:hypothetical protein